MSKLAQNIVTTITGEKAPKSHEIISYLDSKFEVENTIDSTYNRAITIQVKLSCKKWLDCKTLKDEEFYSVIRSVKRAMIEEVFGEFRPYLLEIRSALYDINTTRASKLLVELEQLMFEEGL